MKKVLVALVIVMGLGFSVVKADEPLKKKSAKVEQRDSREDFTPIVVNNLPEAVIDELSCEGALIKEAFIAYSRSEGKLYKVIILSSDFHEQAVFLNERGNILNR